MARAAMVELSGLGASPGIAIGQAVTIRAAATDLYRIPLEPGTEEAEVERFHQAVETTRQELAVTRGSARSSLGEELAAVFDAHTLMLSDRALLDRIEARIRDESVNAEWAVHLTGEELGERFEAIETPHLRERHEDLMDVTRYLLRCLQGLEHHHDISEISGDIVVVAHDLTPSDAIRLGRERVVGFAVEKGGPTSHTAIIARALDVPLVTGLPEVTAKVTDNEPVIVDGDRGLVVLHPSAERLAEYEKARGLQGQLDSRRAATRRLTCQSRDGVQVTLMANIELLEEIAQARRYGALGVGLYRSEFLYIERSPELPSEDDHYAVYRDLMVAAAPHPAVIRTLDLGGRKLAREVLATREDNPVLGLRGIRLTMARPEIFRTQLRGLFRAGVHAPLWILLPMVTSVAEVREFRRFGQGVLDELRREGVAVAESYRLGAMIEVPSAALTVDSLAREVDFLSIGTNDLIQYSLAVDRNNEHVSYLYRPLHPAILRMIRSVVEHAEAASIGVSLCGEMAADPLAAGLLVGLGMRTFSLSPRMIPAIKTRIRDLDVEQMSRLARQCLQCATADEVEERLQNAAAGAVLPG